MGVNDIGRGEMGERYLPKSVRCLCHASITVGQLSVSDHTVRKQLMPERWCNEILPILGLMWWFSAPLTADPCVGSEIIILTDHGYSRICIFDKISRRPLAFIQSGNEGIENRSPNLARGNCTSYNKW